MEVIKISDHEVEVRVTQPAKVESSKHNRKFIEQQLISIQAQKAAFDAARDIEIAECQFILDEMDRLGIVSKPAGIVVPSKG